MTGERKKSHLFNLRRQAGIRAKELAKLLGISESQYSRHEAAGSFKMPQLKIIAAALNCPIDALSGDATSSPGPMLARLARTFPAFEIIGGELAAMGFDISDDAEVSVEAMFVTVPDNAMAPRIMAGDRVLVDPAAQPTPGRIVLAEAPMTREVIFRMYAPLHPSDPRAPGYFLRALDPAFTEVISTRDQPGRIIGVARYRRSEI